MTPEEQVHEMHAVVTKQGRATWTTVRGTSIVFAIFACLIVGGLFAMVIMLIQRDTLDEATWGAIMAMLGYIGGVGTTFGAIAHMRADESPPQMSTETALEFAKLAREQGLEDGIMHQVHKQVN